jgi:predicted glycosyltransferase
MRYWVDMDNAPHVLVMTPIIRRLRMLGHEVEITARDYGQTIPLLELRGLPYVVIGRHSGRGKLGKYVEFMCRSWALLRYARGRRFDVALCHGTRAIYIPSRLLRIPLVVLGDYEHTTLPAFMGRWVTLALIPDVIPPTLLARLGISPTQIKGYPGLKEDLYIHEMRPDPSFLSDLGIDTRKVVVLVRPPATMAHYYVEASGRLFGDVLDFLCARQDVEVILLPRTPEQRRELAEKVATQACVNIHIPSRAYDGPSLVWYADLVISGGGTMNREAATLNVPVYSIYQGPLGAVDRHLIQTGRLKLVNDASRLGDIPFRKPQRKGIRVNPQAQEKALDFVLGNILAVTAGRGRSAVRGRTQAPSL